MFKKNIAIIIPTLLSGGSEKQSLYLAEVLSKKANVYFFVLKGSQIEYDYFNIINNSNIHLIRLKGGLYRNIIDVSSVFKKIKIDVCFSYLASGNFVNGVSGLIACMPNRVGGIRNSKLARKKMPFERFFHNHLLTKTISNTYSAVKSLSTIGFRLEKFSVIHNAVHLRHPYIIQKNSKVVNIISVARFVPQKDLLTAISAIHILVNQLARTKYKIQYYLVGYGAQEHELREKILALGLDDHIQVVIKPKDIQSYYRKAHIYFSTSLFEGVPNSVLEALSYSLPIIATSVGDMKYLVNDNENGYLCDTGKPEEMADKIGLLVRDYSLRKSMGKMSYTLVSNHFTLEEYEYNYLRYIDSILA